MSDNPPTPAPATLYLYESPWLAENECRRAHPDSHPDRLPNGDYYAFLGSGLLGRRFGRIVLRFDSAYHTMHDPRAAQYLGEAVTKLIPGGRLEIEDRYTGEALLNFVTATAMNAGEQ